MLGTHTTGQVQRWFSRHGGAEPSTELGPFWGCAQGGSLGCGICFAEGVYRDTFPYHHLCCTRLVWLCLAERCQTTWGGPVRSLWLSLLSFLETPLLSPQLPPGQSILGLQLVCPVRDSYDFFLLMV